MSARCSISRDLTLQRSALKVYVDLSLIGYAVTLAAATRKPAAYGLSQLGELIRTGEPAWADRADPGAGTSPSSTAATTCSRRTSARS